MDTPAKSALTLAIIAAVLTALVAVVASFTRERITRNEQAWIRQRSGTSARVRIPSASSVSTT